jgi:hypothetical protein
VVESEAASEEDQSYQELKHQLYLRPESADVVIRTEQQDDQTAEENRQRWLSARAQKLPNQQTFNAAPLKNGRLGENVVSRDCVYICWKHLTKANDTQHWTRRKYVPQPGA